MNEIINIKTDDNWVIPVKVIASTSYMSGEIIYKIGVTHNGGLWLIGDWVTDKPFPIGEYALRDDYPELYKKFLANFNKDDLGSIPYSKRTWE